MSAPPKWAQDLILDALVFLGHEDVPALTWHRSRSRYSHGKTQLQAGKGRIFITAGSYRLDAKMLVLHELAHHVTQAWHTAAFWDTAWVLYRWAKLPVKYVKAREGNFRKGALVAYRRNLRSGRKGIH